MALQSQRLYGLPNGLTVAPTPNLRRKVDPTVVDMALPGTSWTNYIGNTYWLALSQNVSARTTNWQKVSFGGGAGVFSSLTVTPGPINLTGVTTVLGNTSINASGTGTTSIGSGTNTGNITIGSGGVSAQTITLETGATGAININGTGMTKMEAITDIEASPSATSTIDANVGYSTFTGFTTAAAATQVFTILNVLATTTSTILVSVDNGGANDAQMTITRVKMAVGSIQVTVVNNGAAALNGDVNISFWLMD